MAPTSVAKPHVVELSAPDITPYKSGNTEIDYVSVFDSQIPGPHIMISALVHGNELCGAIALDWIFANNIRPQIGKLSLAFANVEAYHSFDPDDPFTSRYIDEDFNRVWHTDKLDGDQTSCELSRARQIRPYLDDVDYLFDIHSMQQPSPPMLLAGALEKGCKFAANVGVPELVTIDHGHADGVRMRDYGEFADPRSQKNALLIECGQHWENASAQVAKMSSVRMLVAMGLIPHDHWAVSAVARPQLKPQKFVRITDAITIKSSKFQFARMFKGGALIPSKGTLIGHDGDQPVRTPYDDCILIMPTLGALTGQTAVRLGQLITA